MLRIIYMGTPAFAVPALEALIAHRAPGALLPQGYELATIITRPDKPAGRGRAMNYSPIKQCALAHGLPIWQPGSFKKQENSEALANYHADLYIVAAFGQILPQSVLDQPRYGILNIHASLLPRYRGPDPIAETIVQAEQQSGVTIMLLDVGVDTGPILDQRALPLADDETTASLTEKLAVLGAEALLETLPGWIAGEIVPQPQDARLATVTHMLHKEDGEIRWHEPAALIARKVRAYTPWPTAYTHWSGKLLKILSAHAIAEMPKHAETPGMVNLYIDGHEGRIEKRALAVETGEGMLLIEQLQLEGKKAMRADEFQRGYGQIVGEVLS